MIQLAGIDKIEAKDIHKLVNMITPELNKRKQLYLRYKRKADDSGLIFETGENKKTSITLEKYIVDISAGYLGGKQPSYEVKDVTDEKKRKIIERVLDKTLGKDDYKEEMQILIDYIKDFNDDATEHYQLVKDMFMMTGCYELIYQNENDDIVYSHLDPMQTVAIWDYSVPKNLIGLVRMWEEKDVDSKTITKVEITDKTGTRLFKGSGESYEEIVKTDEKGNVIYNNHNWGDVPAIVVEQEDGIALFEPAVDLIKAFEQLVQNTRSTFQYNDSAKLKVVGYSPTEPLMIEKDGQMVENPLRKKADELLLKAKVFYTPDASGDIAWIEKNINDSAIQNSLKTYMDLITMLSGVPNVTDVGFTNADNSSALEKKFFPLEQITIELMKMLEMAYLRRWELIFNRINLRKNTKYDFRDVNVVLEKNMPTNTSEIIGNWLKLRGLISDETIIERLPLDLDPISEKNKMEEQTNEEMEREITKEKAFTSINDKKPKDKEKLTLQK